MKHLLLLLSLFSFAEILYSQNYVPFPTSNTTWLSVQKYLQPQNKCCSDCLESEITIAGDSVVNGLKYKILNQTNILKDALGGGSVFCTRIVSDTSSFLGLLRDDTAQQKVYLRIDTTEFLMYDFSAQLGDTISIHTVFNQNLVLRQAKDYVIDTVYTSLIAGKQRRVFVIKEPILWSYYSQFVEGIGSTGGLFRFGMNNYSKSDYRNELYCFNEQGVGTYSPHGKPCALITGVEDQKKSEEKVTIFPNPTNEKITIQSNQVIVSIQLLSIEGKLIRDLSVGQKQVEVDLPSQNGIYFLKIINQDGSLQMKKVIKE